MVALPITCPKCGHSYFSYGRCENCAWNESEQQFVRAEITCVWTNEMARRMFDGYRLQLDKLHKDAIAGRPLARNLEEELIALTNSIHNQMAGLVRDFTILAACWSKK